jgi:hypothetical protein
MFPDPRFPDRRPYFVSRKGVMVPDVECLDSFERIPPTQFEEWMAWMYTPLGEAVPIPYPQSWHTLKFPYPPEPPKARERGMTRPGRPRTHGMSRTKVCRAWLMMPQRCHNPNATGFADTGGRGITVDEAWDQSFAAFYAYVGDPPPGTSLDRIDVNGDYAPGNVRWATAWHQTRNRRRNYSSSRRA